MSALSVRKFAVRSLVLLLICIGAGRLHAEDGDVLLNKEKPVDLLAIKKGMDGVWATLKVGFPEAAAVFLYSQNKVEFGVFDLHKENQYFVFLSQPHATSFKLQVDGVEVEKVKKCFLKHTLGDDPEQYTRFFGYLFTLEDGETCSMRCDGEYNAGAYEFVLNRGERGLWEGRVNVKND